MYIYININVYMLSDPSDTTACVVVVQGTESGRLHLSQTRRVKLVI